LSTEQLALAEQLLPEELLSPVEQLPEDNSYSTYVKAAATSSY
jgi:hypothetical protein